jgi:hypothetical protein
LSGGEARLALNNEVNRAVQFFGSHASSNRSSKRRAQFSELPNALVAFLRTGRRRSYF